jgi:hypothetical protein
VKKPHHYPYIWDRGAEKAAVNRGSGKETEQSFNANESFSTKPLQKRASGIGFPVLYRAPEVGERDLFHLLFLRIPCGMPLVKCFFTKK